MTDNDDAALINWLFTKAGPIIRWRLVQDFSYPLTIKEASQLKQKVHKNAEVKYWLDNLGAGGIHGSMDTDAENSVAKIVEYGLHAGINELDDKLLSYADRIGEYQPSWLSDIITPFLIAVGYTHHKAVRKWFQDRLNVLCAIARKADYDLYLGSEETPHLPKAWQGKKIFRSKYLSGESIPLPSCYDLYALAHWQHNPESLKKAEVVISFLSHPEFQTTPGGYVWDREKNRCYSTGRAWLACCEPQRLVLFTELSARFASARKSSWFKTSMADLEQYRTPRGIYCFPSDYLKEKRNSYYLYQGAHMGLCENRRKRSWIEIESTFRMLNIKRLMDLDNI